MTDITYCVSLHQQSDRGSLFDRGANGGLAGNDTRVISRTGRLVDVVGIDGHQMPGIPIVNAGAVVETDQGPLLIIMNQYAHCPLNSTIHSAAQWEHHGAIVDDKSRLFGGNQCVSLDQGRGPRFPLDIVDARLWPHASIS
jgi:hypothetical protein